MDPATPCSPPAAISPSLIGFPAGFAIVVWVEKQMPARVEATVG